MHPILAQKGRLGLYLVAWLPVALLLAGLVSLAGPGSWLNALVLVLPLAGIYAFQCLTAWHLCRNFALEPPELLRTAAVLSAAAFLSASLWLFIGSGWAEVISSSSRFAGSLELFRRSYPLLFAAGVLLFFLAAAASYLLVAAEAAREEQRKSLELKILAQDAELRALKAQINPHFLFNSLNSVVALIPSDPGEARRMCLHLSDFLRKSIRAASLQAISLAEELSLLQDFLEIERIRFGARLQARLEVEEQCGSCTVPPLILQPLIENAVSHGIAHKLEGGEIRLQARRHGSRLMIGITNPCDADRPRSTAKGIGLTNVRRRLDALYGGEARFDAFEKNGVYHAEITMPC